MRSPWAYGAGRAVVLYGGASLGNPSASALHGTQYGACTVGNNKSGVTENAYHPQSSVVCSGIATSKRPTRYSRRHVAVAF